MLKYFLKFLICNFYCVIINLIAGYICIINFINQLNVNDQIKLTYDYIIVGTGTAGLSIILDIDNDDVAILEAGGPTTTLLDIPVLTPSLHQTHYDWNYYTVSQTNSCFGLNDHKSRWPMGKGYGGSQILNNMIYNRGHREDYRGWFSDPADYNYENDVLKYFLESEKLLELNLDSNYERKLADAFMRATKQYGLTGDEFYLPKLQQRKGKRFTTAHVNHHIKRNGHHYYYYATVKRIILKKLVAHGVLYERNGIVYEVYARKGIILTAGTIGSAQILLASGIGPKKTYENSSIPFVLDLPVGQNLQDHITTGMDMILLNKPTLQLEPWHLLSFENVYNYMFKSGVGPLSMAGCEALGFLNTNVQNASKSPIGDTDRGSKSRRWAKPQPDLGFMIIPMGATVDGGAHIRNLLNIKDDIWYSYYDPSVDRLDQVQPISILPILLHPKSRGRVTLAPSTHKLVIDPNYLTDDDDLMVLIRGIRIIQQLLKMPAMQMLGAELNPKPLRPCTLNNVRFNSNEYWRCYIRHLTFTAYHPVGTCRMGAEFDKRTVVLQHNFQVKGIINLYVADASTMPNLPSANPNAVVGMLAKRFVIALNKLNIKYKQLLSNNM